jgi:hypothetical protein
MGLTLRLVQLFLYFPKTYEHCQALHACEFSILPLSVISSFQSLFTIRIVLFYYQHALEGSAVIYTNTQLQLLYYTFLSYITRAWDMPTSFVHNLFLHLAKGWVLQVPLSLQWVSLDTLIIALSYKDTLSRRNIDEFQAIRMLLTSSIRGHLLSLKFHPQMVTGIQHLQTTISSPMDQK